MQRLALWYFARLYVCVRPERVYVWDDGDPAREPRLLETHMEEVRSGHAEEPVAPVAEPVGVPLRPGRACVTAHDHHPDFTWQRNFQVRGDLLEDGDGWALVPRKLVGGFELPPGSRLSALRRNARDIMRYRRIARAELKRRRG